ncbi:MAG: putative extracytoplasmic binding receptor, partial [Pseudomonadota bacterium]
RALVISSDARSTQLPAVPTIAEAGHAGSSFALTLGLWAPGGTPASTVDAIAAEVARELANPAVLESLTRLGGEPLKMTPSEFDRLVRNEINDLKRTIAAAKLTAQ